MTKESWQAEYLAAISQETRIKIINYLKKDWKYTEDLNKYLNKHFSNVSRHLNILYKIGIIEKIKVDQRTKYKLLNQDVLKILKLIPKGLGI